jgi:RNA-directed DNA polymerase
MPMVRYADDLLLFFETEEEARAGQEFVDSHLHRVGLKLAQRRQQFMGLSKTLHFWD